MPAEPLTRRGCQFSLRTFLIATLAIGVGAGLLGRLFFANRDTFMGVVALLSTAGPFLLAIGTIVWIGLRRKPDRRWGLIAWGGVLLLMPIVGVGMLLLADHFVPWAFGGRFPTKPSAAAPRLVTLAVFKAAVAEA